MQQVLKQTAESEQSREEVQLTELVPMKRSRIKENVLKDVDATDGLKALRSISSDCNDKSDIFDMSELDFSKNVEQQPEQQSGKQRRVQKARRKTKNGSKNDIEDMDSGDEEKNDDETAEKKTNEQEEPSTNGMRLRPRNNTMIARKKPARSSKETDDRKKRNNDLSKKNSTKVKIPLDDEDFAPEGSDIELCCDSDKSDCYKDEVYVYRQEPKDQCSNSASKKSESINQEKASSNADSTADSEKDGVADKDSTKNKCKLDINGIIPEEGEEKNSENELKAKSVKENCLRTHENNNRAVPKEPMSSEKMSAAATKPTQCEEESPPKSESELSDKMIEQARARLQSWQKKYCCVVCFARFKGSGGLRNHYKVLHGSGPVYKCDECGKEFPLKERLKLHVRTHTGFKPYKCPECDKSFARGGQLVQHRRTHSQDKPFQCKLCSNSFTCAANLSLHVKRHKGQKDHKCDLCGRAFVRRDALKKHLECLHRDVKSFVCVICNKTFKGHLPQHMRTHARDRPHGCATCGQRFAQKSQLTVHQRTHSGQRPFRCVVCWQAFAHSTALKLHTRRHTGERPFKCNECNAGFTQLPHWKKHMKCIHGRTDPYGCRWCTSFFRIKSELESHMKTCHSEMDEDDSDFGDAGGDGDGEGDSISVDESLPGTSTAVEQQQQGIERQWATKYKMMTVEKMRLLLAVLLQRISKQEKLAELGFGKRLIDDVLQDSLVSAGKEPIKNENHSLSELEALTRNLEIFLEWTMPKEHWETFRKMNKTPENILEALTSEYDIE